MSLLGNAFGLAAMSAAAEKVKSAAAKAHSLAQVHLGDMLETAEVQYDETGRAVISTYRLPEGPSVSDDSKANSRISALIDEREQLRERTNEQLNQLQDQLARRLELAEEHRAEAEARVHGAVEREEQLEQRLLSLEVHLDGEQARRRMLEVECEELRALRREHATSTEGAAIALTAAVDAEAARWRGDVEEMRSERAKAQRRCEQLEQEVKGLREAWRVDQEALRLQLQQQEQAHPGDGTRQKESTSVAEAAEAAKAVEAAGATAATATRMLLATRSAEHAREMTRVVDEARATLRAEHELETAQAVAGAHHSLEAIRQDRDACMRQVKELRVAVGCMTHAIAEQDVCLARTAADAQRAVEERAALKAQVQHGVDAASEHLESATREAAHQVRDAELHAANLRRELDELQQTVAKERADVAAERESAEEHRKAQARTLAATVSELDGAQQELRKVRGELEALRLHLLDDEEESSQREGQLSDHVRTLEAAAADLEARRQSAEAAAAASENRAGRAESARASAERRVVEQTTALSNLQTVLEHLQLQSTGPSEELTQLRLGGRLLAAELHQMETEHAGAVLARDELPKVRRKLEEEREANLLRHEQMASMQALLRAAKDERSQDSVIDKQLVASVLVKYVEGGNSAQVLAVLASMLGCSHPERQRLGLVPRTMMASHPDAKLSDLWTDFLLAESGDGATGASAR